MSHNYDFDALHARGKSLEDAYFADRDRELIENLKRQLSTAESKRLHAMSLGVSEEHIEREFAHLGPGLDVIPTMAILPLVEVAWCDGNVAAAEKAAILRAVHELGIAKDSPFSQFLQSWLDARPSAAALELWKLYVKEFLGTVSADTKATIREGIMGRAEKVAAAAGGILGYNTISTTEQKCLRELGAAFE